MKISLNWLQSLLESDQTADQLDRLLTGAGLEVESREIIESVPGGLKGLIVGEVLECVKHPDADRLTLAKVNVGNGAPLSIVCGAPNVAAGQKVIVARPGTRLFPLNGEPFEIKKSKIRGQVSEGMICAEDEIGIGNSHNGIIVLPPDTETGLEAAEVFGIQRDEVFEIGLTPNRSDAASHFGVARDLAAILNTHQHTQKYVPSIPGVHALQPPRVTEEISVEVLDKAACPRYCGLAIRGVSVSESPAWMQARLKAIGVRPINNVVDVTNFVLHELGQPLHAFDLDRINGRKIVVRRAADGEKFTTLEGIERTLRSSDLMICDERSPMCIAGVFGGEKSGVTSETTGIFLESAYFDPASVRRTARAHALRTDASFRFERGADPDMTVTALIRAANLILELAGGEVVSETIDVYPEKMEPYKVAFSYKNCNDVAGKDLDRSIMKSILLNLGIKIDSEGTDGLLLYVPRHKHDVTREADVIEEILRIYGYDHIEPARHLSYAMPAADAGDHATLSEKIAENLVANGFREIMSLSLTSESHYDEKEDLVRILNPLSSELGVMRKSLITGGLQAIAHNTNRQHEDLRIFEFGNVYRLQDRAKYQEKKELVMLVTGELFAANAYGFQSRDGFGLLKSALSMIFRMGGLPDVRSEETKDPQFSYGLNFTSGKNLVATAGLIKQETCEKAGVTQPAYGAVIDWEKYASLASPGEVVFVEPGRFPFVTRDLALLLDRKTSYGELVDLAFRTEKKLLEDVSLFDIYQDTKLGDRKSYAVRFTLCDRNSTLTDQQIDQAMDRLVTAFRDTLGAQLR